MTPARRSSGAARLAQGTSRLQMVQVFAHALAFAVITAGIFLNAPQWSRLQVAGVAFSIGMGVELIQSLTGRDFEVRDALADLVGIVVVACLWWGRKWI